MAKDRSALGWSRRGQWIEIWVLVLPKIFGKADWKRKLSAEPNHREDNYMNYVKCCTKCAVMASVAGLMPCEAASSAAQTPNKSVNNSDGISPSRVAMQVFTCGPMDNLRSQPLPGFPDALQAASHRIRLGDLSDQSQPGFEAIALEDKITPTAAGDRLVRSGVAPDSTSKSAWDHLGSPHLKYSRAAQPLLLKRPGIAPPQLLTNPIGTHRTKINFL